jgi:hypothetical protein
MPNTFEECCLCSTSKYDQSLSEYEAEFIHVEGVCVDCKIITLEAEPASTDAERIRNVAVVSLV